MPTATSATLLEQVKARQPEAWKRLVDLYGPEIYRWCRLCGVDRDDAADVAQEVFRTVADKIADFHHDRVGDSFHGWLQASSVYRRSRRRPTRCRPSRACPRTTVFRIAS